MDVLKHVDGLLIDLDGVLYLNQQAVPGACKALETIRSSRIPLRFVTNTTRMNPETIANHMRSLGFSASPDEIISPPVAAADHMRQYDLYRYHLLASHSLLGAFEDFEQVDEGADVVIIGDLGEVFTFQALNHAFRLIMSGATILALHKDRFWQTESGPRLDTGASVNALEYASGNKAIIVGKPDIHFFEIALSELGLPAESVAMVGDSIDTDIGGAQAAGLTGILVRTGNYHFLSDADSSVNPDLIIDSIADLPSIIV